MSQFFSFSRFGRLLRKHLTEHLPGYLLSVAVLAGTVLVVLGSLTYLMHKALDPTPQAVLYIFGLLGAGVVFTSSVFAELGAPRTAAPALLLPASHLEKYLVAWLLSLPVFVAVYVAVFLGVDALVLQLSAQGRPTQLLDLSGSRDLLLLPLLGYALLHSLALWGALYFQRLYIVKTAFLIFGVALVTGLVNTWLLKGLSGSVLSAGQPFGDARVHLGQETWRLTLPHSPLLDMVWLVPLSLAGLLWLASYARLTEKQL